MTDGLMCGWCHAGPITPHAVCPLLLGWMQLGASASCCIARTPMLIVLAAPPVRAGSGDTALSKTYRAVAAEHLAWLRRSGIHSACKPWPQRAQSPHSPGTSWLSLPLPSVMAIMCWMGCSSVRSGSSVCDHRCSGRAFEPTEGDDGWPLCPNDSDQRIWSAAID